MHNKKKERKFQRHKLMEWFLVSPDINPIEKLWSIIKRGDVYENEKLFKQEIFGKQ